MMEINDGSLQYGLLLFSAERERPSGFLLYLRKSGEDGHIVPPAP